jgi:hypothetical protein
MRAAGGPGNALAQELTAEIGGRGARGAGEFSDPKRERSGPRGGCCGARGLMKSIS